MAVTKIIRIEPRGPEQTSALNQALAIANMRKTDPEGVEIACASRDPYHVWSDKANLLDDALWYVAKASVDSGIRAAAIYFQRNLRALMPEIHFRGSVYAERSDDAGTSPAPSLGSGDTPAVAGHRHPADRQPAEEEERKRHDGRGAYPVAVIHESVYLRWLDERYLDGTLRTDDAAGQLRRAFPRSIPDWKAAEEILAYWSFTYERRHGEMQS